MRKVSVSPGEAGAQEEMGKSVGMEGGGENAFISKFRARNWPTPGVSNLFSWFFALFVSIFHIKKKTF